MTSVSLSGRVESNCGRSSMALVPLCICTTRSEPITRWIPGRVPCPGRLDTHRFRPYDPGAGYGSFYVNGQLAAQPFLGKGILAQTSHDFPVGSTPGEFKGMIDEMTFYRRPISAQEMQAIYTSGAAGKSPVNEAPVVTVSPSPKCLCWHSDPARQGAAADDGLPNPPGVLTYQWTSTSPGGVTFGSPNALSTSATFATAGTYAVTLTANDSALTGSGNATITVSPPPSIPSVSITSPANNAGIVANSSMQILATATDAGGNDFECRFLRLAARCWARPPSPRLVSPRLILSHLASGLAKWEPIP